MKLLNAEDASRTVDPAAIETVDAALPLFTLQTMLEPEGDVTGLLFTGWRTAVELVELPAIRVFQMSKEGRQTQFQRRKYHAVQCAEACWVSKAAITVTENFMA